MPAGKPSGFSLIELAIILLIAGIIMTPTLMNYELYYKERQVSTTTRDIGLVKRALQKYASLYGCYPVPGNPAAASTDATFGQEAIERITCGALPDARVKALPACKGDDTAMCRTATGKGGMIVYIGDIPFAALGLPHDYILDGYGSKMTYGVSASLTFAGSFRDTGGAIIVHDNSGSNTRDIVPTDGNIHYIVVSHGKDKVGAFTPEGILQFKCGAIAAADNENCNNDAIFTDNHGMNGVGANAQYTRLQYAAAGPDHYDDYVGWTITTMSDLWVRQPLSGNILNNNNGNIRIGLAGNLPPLAKVDVRDLGGEPGIKADALWTSDLCDAAAGCPAAKSADAANAAQSPPGSFMPAIIGGIPDLAQAGKPGGGISCADDAALTGIANADELCAYNKAPTDPGIKPCPSGTYAVGIESRDKTICKLP